MGGTINTTSWFPTLELEETLLTLEGAGVDGNKCVGIDTQVCGNLRFKYTGHTKC